VPATGVALAPGSSPFATAFDTNLAYLAQFPLDDVLYWFRVRAGVPLLGGSSWGWDGAENGGGGSGGGGGRQHVAHNHGRTGAAAAPAPRGVNVDGPFGLRGSVAGAFMMGAGGCNDFDINDFGINLTPFLRSASTNAVATAPCSVEVVMGAGCWAVAVVVRGSGGEGVGGQRHQNIYIYIYILGDASC